MPPLGLTLDPLGASVITSDSLFELMVLSSMLLKDAQLLQLPNSGGRGSAVRLAFHYPCLRDQRRLR